MTALQARDRRETDRGYVGVADGGNSSSACVHRQRSPAQWSLDVNVAKQYGTQTEVAQQSRSRAHLWLSVWTEEVKGGQSSRTGAARQLVNAADNQMDGPICQGATVASCLATLLHLVMPQKEVGIYCNHVNSSFEYSLMNKFVILFSQLHNLSAKHLLLHFSARVTDLYVLIGLSWLKLAYSFVTAMHLGANLIPESTLTWLSWGGSFITELQHSESDHYHSGEGDGGRCRVLGGMRKCE